MLISVTKIDIKVMTFFKKAKKHFLLFKPFFYTNQLFIFYFPFIQTFKMPSFKDLSEKICKILNGFSHERCMVLFGEPNRFEAWLISNQVTDLVSNYNPLIL
jgi:hypothetical protein